MKNDLEIFSEPTTTGRPAPVSIERAGNANSTVVSPRDLGVRRCSV